MSAYVYLIENKINDKIYIGKTINPKSRWRYHKKVARGGFKKYPNDFFILHQAMVKYGIENFSFEVIDEYFSEEEAYQAEADLVLLGCSNLRKIGYNCSTGGKGGFKLTEEHRRKQSEAQIGSKHSQAKLNEEKVIEILNLYKTGNYTQRKLAEMFGVHFASINDIIKNKTWVHINR